MRIQKELEELERSGVINLDTRERIAAYYQSKKGSGQNRMSIAFGILGATMVGLGIILILAHNWDTLSIAFKTTIAFVPLVFSQVLCGYTLVKKPGNKTWIESCSTLLVFSIGSGMALVSQIYNIEGNLSEFVLTWVLLILPVIYIMKSDLAAILTLIGITWFGHESNDGVMGIIYGQSSAYMYWLLMLTVIPYMVISFIKGPKTSALVIQLWLISVSVLSMIIYLEDRNEELLYLIFGGLFGIYYILGRDRFFRDKMILSNPFNIIGLIGSFILLYLGSFSDWWAHEFSQFDTVYGRVIEPEIAAIIIGLVLYGLAFARYWIRMKREPEETFDPMTFIFPILCWMYLWKGYGVLSAITANVLILGLGVYTIIKGAKRDHLGILNLGMIILGILVTCRFFDENISFVLRGSMFLLLGIGFFGTNFYLLKKRRSHEVQ